ncbi:MAG: TylF/MycF/NovP-related O-methyltransferase [Minisyncoccia bacterium]
MPWPIFFFFKKIRALPEDLPAFISFLFEKNKIPIGFYKRLLLILKCYQISYYLDPPHMEGEMIRVISFILSSNAPEGVIVEAGAYKGASSAKISLAAKLTNRKFYIFDSFEGLPKHNEIHGKNIFGGDAYFPPGSYAGSLDEVKNNIKKYGKIEVCEFVKGWFENTMPNFKEKICSAYIDVDLETSTKTCLKYLYPLLESGGVIFSQDGHLPWVIKVLDDDNFWQKEVGFKKPLMKGLGKKKLVAILK